MWVLGSMLQAPIVSQTACVNRRMGAPIKGNNIVTLLWKGKLLLKDNFPFRAPCFISGRIATMKAITAISP